MVNGSVGCRSGAATGCQRGNLIGMEDTHPILTVICSHMVIMTEARINPPSVWVSSGGTWVVDWFQTTASITGHDSSARPAWPNIDGLVQDCSNSSALAMELLQSCTKPSICRLCTVLYIAFMATFSILICIFSWIKVFESWILRLLSHENAGINRNRLIVEQLMFKSRKHDHGYIWNR